MFKKTVVLINSLARSRQIDDAGMKSACEHLCRFRPCELIYTTGIDDFVSKIKSYSADSETLLAVAGGDGTLNLALNEMAEDAVLGVIPIGTANVVARELGLPSRIRDAFKLLLTGAVQKIDLGVCNNKKFAFVCGIGFDAVCADAVSKKLKTCLGQAAYAVAAIKTILTYKPARLTIECEDGRVVEGEFAIFPNMRRYGGELYFAPEARHDDGIMNLVLLKKFNLLSLLKLVKYAYGKGSFPDEVALKLTGRSFKVIASKPTMYELDGEVFGPEKSFEIGVKPLSQKIMTT